MVGEYRQLTQQEIQFRHHHDARGKEIPVRPHLALPFRSGTRIQITEGAIYSAQERAIHGIEYHGGIDFKVPYGTDVLMPATRAIVTASYQAAHMTDDTNKRVQMTPAELIANFKKHNLPEEEINKLISLDQNTPRNIIYGMGLFVTLYISPDSTAGSREIIQLGHLSQLSPKLWSIFTDPTYDADGDFNPVGHNLRRTQLEKFLREGRAIEMEASELIGKVGHSGLGFGLMDGEMTPDGFRYIERANDPSYDEDHVHFEVANRSPINNYKAQRDVYGEIYGESGLYLPHQVGPEPLLLVNSQGAPLYADQIVRREIVKV